MIAVYLRVSTKDQKTDSQVPQLKDWIERNAPNETVQWFEDNDQSSQKLSRPAFREMQKGIVSGKIDTVVVWKLDRISRSIADGVTTIHDWLARDIRVVSVTQPIDLSGPIGMAVAALLFAIAEGEFKDRRERQAAGIALAKKRGVYKGRKAGITKAAPARAKQLAEQGLTLNEIGNALGVSVRTVSRYLAA